MSSSGAPSTPAPTTCRSRGPGRLHGQRLELHGWHAPATEREGHWSPWAATATCTITNDDNAPKLTLDKVVVNDNGGTTLPSAWTLTATGTRSPTGDADRPGAAGDADVVERRHLRRRHVRPVGDRRSGRLHGQRLELLGGGRPAPRRRSRSPLGGDIDLHDHQRRQRAEADLSKVVVNDNGGTDDRRRWTLTANGTGTDGDADRPWCGRHARRLAVPTFDAGTYALSERRVRPATRPATGTASAARRPARADHRRLG